MLLSTASIMKDVFDFAQDHTIIFGIIILFLAGSVSFLWAKIQKAQNRKFDNNPQQGVNHYQSKVNYHNQQENSALSKAANAKDPDKIANHNAEAKKHKAKAQQAQSKVDQYMRLMS